LEVTLDNSTSFTQQPVRQKRSAGQAGWQSRPQAASPGGQIWPPHEGTWQLLALMVQFGWQVSVPVAVGSPV
jgi:hypothetical protein